MGFICDFIDDIVDWVKEHWEFVVLAIIAIVVTIITFNPGLGMAIYSTVAGTIAGLIEGIGLISTGTAITALDTIGALTVSSVATASAISSFISAIAVSFGAFLEAIHFKTLLAIHEIAYLLSDEYRLMLASITQDIMEYSESLGMGSTFVLLGIQNVRTLVLDVSSMLGRP